MDNIINLKDRRTKKIFDDAGLDTKNLLLCFNGYQFAQMINKIFTTQKMPDEVLGENRDLYKIGYFDQNTNKIHVFNKPE